MIDSKPLHVIVKFDDGVPVEAQGPALLVMEKHLRVNTGLDCRVLKDRMADDSKLRVRMTQAERDRL